MVYGWDQRIADAPASILQTEKFKVNKQVRNKIKPSSGTNGRYRYYLGLQFENGRFSTDFKNTNQGKGPLFVSNFLDLSQTLYIQ